VAKSYFSNTVSLEFFMTEQELPESRQSDDQVEQAASPQTGSQPDAKQKSLTPGEELLQAFGELPPEAAENLRRRRRHDRRWY